jgi:hypothetical protein
MNAPAPLSPEARAAQTRRNKAIALALVAFVVVVFLITVVRLGPGVLNRPL